MIDEILRGAGQPSINIELVDDWGHAARAALDAMEVPERTAWIQLLLHARTATTAKPSSKWLATARERVAALGEERFRAIALQWLGFWDTAPPVEGMRGIGWGRVPSSILATENTPL